MARGGSTFGLSSSRARGSFRPAGYRGRGRGRGRGGASNGTREAPRREDDGTQLAERFERIKINDEVDEKLGFLAIQEGATREGWLVNMHPVCSLRPRVWLHYTHCVTDSGERRGLAVRKSGCRLLFHPGRWVLVQDYIRIRALFLYCLQGR
jgi:hypothetical protein